MSGLDRRLTPEEFREVMGHFTSGVTVITTVDGDEPLGTTASAVASLSLEPPMLLVCLNRDSVTGQGIVRSGAFGVNILQVGQEELARHFARKEEHKFTDVPYAPGAFGQPLLGDALAHLECRVTEEVTAGTHSVFLAEVETAGAGAGTPLAYFRGRFGRLDTGIYDPDTAAGF
jgi:4-nitrophenol 2-monooxygenase / 4-nitrocatechol 4-monooxygenase, reductase component